LLTLVIHIDAKAAKNLFITDNQSIKIYTKNKNCGISLQPGAKII